MGPPALTNSPHLCCAWSPWWRLSRSHARTASWCESAWPGQAAHPVGGYMPASQLLTISPAQHDTAQHSHLHVRSCVISGSASDSHARFLPGCCLSAVACFCAATQHKHTPDVLHETAHPVIRRGREFSASPPAGWGAPRERVPPTGYRVRSQLAPPMSSSHTTVASFVPPTRTLCSGPTSLQFCRRVRPAPSWLYCFPSLSFLVGRLHWRVPLPCHPSLHFTVPYYSQR
jgi:hypothetical protein